MLLSINIRDSAEGVSVYWTLYKP